MAGTNPARRRRLRRAELLSVGRARPRSSGDFPAGLRIVTLESGRARRRSCSRGAPQRADARRRPHTARGFSLWIDIQLVRHLRPQQFVSPARPEPRRRRASVLVRLHHHVKPLGSARRCGRSRCAAAGRADRLTVRDGESSASTPRRRFERIPNTVRRWRGRRRPHQCSPRRDPTERHMLLLRRGRPSAPECATAPVLHDARMVAESQHPGGPAPTSATDHGALVGVCSAQLSDRLVLLLEQ